MDVLSFITNEGVQYESDNPELLQAFEKWREAEPGSLHERAAWEGLTELANDILSIGDDFVAEVDCL